ncbi:MAG TPA: hypothetical protein VNR18_03110 [Hyphomicrobiales bacterium]|nr:hypothetical protein [Hyphomicrobiales bacterium]
MKAGYITALTLSALCTAMLAGGALAQERGRHAAPDVDRHGAAEAGHHRGGRAMPRDDMRDLTRLDTDADGRVSEAEFLDARLARVDAMFERRDRDNDGLITVEDRGPRRDARRQDNSEVLECVRQSVPAFDPAADAAPGMELSNADSDADGYLSLSEMSSALETRARASFARLDGNGDGYLDTAEMAAHDTQLSAVRDAFKNCMPAPSARRRA